MTKQEIFGFTAENGIHFIALRHTKNGKDIIQFFDARYPSCKSPLTAIPAQFISEYYVDTLAEHIGGLNLDGGIPDWRIDAKSFEAVQAALIF